MGIPCTLKGVEEGIPLRIDLEARPKSLAHHPAMLLQRRREALSP
jgi:hypothetical protein